jgi:hypothetical protein
VDELFNGIVFIGEFCGVSSSVSEKKLSVAEEFSLCAVTFSSEFELELAELTAA